MQKTPLYCPVCRSASLSEESPEQIRLGQELRSAIEQSLFTLHYQPQFNLKTGKIIGAEALLRCHHEPLSGVTINNLIQLAEWVGLIDDIGCWVLHEACRQMRAWMDMGYTPIKIAVNVSSFQLINWLTHERALPIIEKFKIPAELIEIEVTETQSILADPRCIDTLEHLRNMGFQIAIDDFGTGYSSLAYLKLLKVHTLKIDQSFIQHLPFCWDDRLIVNAIIGLGNDMGIQILAEGVETEEQAAYLLDSGCNMAQGYYCSKPVSADIFEANYLIRQNLEQMVL